MQVPVVATPLPSTTSPPRASPTNTAWHTMTAADVAQHVHGVLDSGLDDHEAMRRLQRDGPNQIAQARGRSALMILLAQFKSMIVLLLVVATAIAFVMGDRVEAIAILVVIVLNAAIGFATELKAEQTLTALQKQNVAVAHVVRGGMQKEIPAVELVVGDLLALEAGARVGADGRLVECVEMRVEEAVLTGESAAVAKTIDVVTDLGAAVGDRANMAFMGTTITGGRGQLLVTATGAATEMGMIGALIDEAISRDTPLEHKLERLGRVLLIVVAVLCVVIVVAGWLRGHELLAMVRVGISLAIAAVPEGLPAVSTMTLALGMKRMATMGALIRRLPAVETLGATTVICTDKTGTLTRNEMTVAVIVVDDRRIDVDGAGYAPVGTFTIDGVSIDAAADVHLALALHIGAACNDASITRDGGVATVIGDPTEAALVVVAEKAGFTAAALGTSYPRVGEQPFDSVSKRMATVHQTSAGGTVTWVKGSPAALLAASSQQLTANGVTTMTTEAREAWRQINNELASSALRVLALASREGGDPKAVDATKDLVFVGLVGMIDPLRDEARAAMTTCREAGIRTVMITGDQEVTATEIARRLGIDVDLQGRPLRIVHARALKDLDAAGWQKMVEETAVYARASPLHKLQIVEALQAHGEIVAMTGDGVNDAPALKQADIGIAMGIKGTEVAKETADMVIVDDNFATIVRAVEQGRIIYANILRFIHYLFSCNLSEILTVFVALMIGWPLPIGALQILWLNMLTDIFPALALALEPSAPGMMNKPPRDPAESLLTPRFLLLILWQGALLAGASLLAFFIGLRWYGDAGEGLAHAVTIAFMTLAGVQVVHVFSARSQTRSAFDSRLFTNGWLWAAVALCVGLQLVAVYVPFFRSLLRTVALSVQDWGVVVGCAILPLGVIELVKLVQRRRPATATTTIATTTTTTATATTTKA